MDEEDRHLDGRAVFAAMCTAVALLIVLVAALTRQSPIFSAFFSAFGLIFAGASVIAVDEPASPRTRRIAFPAGLFSALLLALVVIAALVAAQSVSVE